MASLWKHGLVSLALLALLLVGCGQADTGGAPSGSGAQDQSPDAPISSDDPPPSGGTNASASGTVAGQVTDAAGSPLAGIMVVPASTANPKLPVPEIAVMTDADGRYQWTLAPGPYDFSFNGDGLASVTQPVTVKPNETTTLDVQLQRQ